MVAGFIKKILFRMNRLNTFVNRYKSAAKEVYLPSLAYINWGIKLLDEGHSKEALKKFEISKDMAYQNPESYLNIGMIKAKNEEFEEAIEYFRKAIRIDNNCAKAYAMLGSAYSEISKSCVTITSVCLFFCAKEVIKSIISYVVFVSRFPVGSSAKTT